MPQIRQDIAIDADEPQRLGGGTVNQKQGSAYGGRDQLLRRSLMANAIFSGASGAVLATAAGPVAAFLGWEDPAAPVVLLGFGACLLVFAAVLVVVARTPRPNATVVRGIVALDGAWVLGSALLLGLGLAPSGRGAVVIGEVAVVVALLATGQALGLARVRRSDRAAVS